MELEGPLNLIQRPYNGLLNFNFVGLQAFKYSVKTYCTLPSYTTQYVRIKHFENVVDYETFCILCHVEFSSMLLVP